jgi:peptidoglycan/LPS O-acetylase OafA/YrhL
VTELALLKTALSLGAFILLAGCYGVFYGIGKLANWRAMRFAGYACYGLQSAMAFGITELSPLSHPWKIVIIVGTLSFLVIPPITWRFVERTHESERRA